MIDYTTYEQSKKLVELGLKPDSADMCYEYMEECDDNFPYYSEPANHSPEDYRDIPCWSFGALLKVLNVESFEIIQNVDDKIVIIPMFKCEEGTYSEKDAYFTDDSYINTAFKMIVWMFNNKPETITQIIDFPDVIERLKKDPLPTLKYIGKFTYFQLMSGEVKKEIGNVAMTDCGTYVCNGKNWEAIDYLSTVELSVIDRGYITGRGYYTVIDNSENIPITLHSTICKGLENLGIVGIEQMKGAIGIRPNWGLITREATEEDTIKIDLEGDRLIMETL